MRGSHDLIHPEPHPLAGKTVKIKQLDKSPQFSGQEYRVEDYWDRVAGKSWMDAVGNPAALNYALRPKTVPMDDEVLYGKIGAFGHLIHVSEVEL